MRMIGIITTSGRRGARVGQAACLASAARRTHLTPKCEYTPTEDATFQSFHILRVRCRGCAGATRQLVATAAHARAPADEATV